MILVDSSVWIDYFRGRDTVKTRILDDQLNKKTRICTCSLIAAELLQGTREDAHFNFIHGYLNNLFKIPVTWETGIVAAEIYRRLRKKGRTVRSTIDCLIAAVALENSVSLLEDDKDFVEIARLTKLKRL